MAEVRQTQTIPVIPESAEPRRLLEQVQQLWALFQQVVGHDLPNHFISIQGLVRVLELEENAKLSSQGRDYLRRLANNVGRIQTLIGGLAEIGRARRENEGAERLALADVAREAAAEVNHLFQGVTIGYHFPQTPLVLIVPRSGLRRVLVHLLRNAVEAASPGQSVCIEIGTRVTEAKAEFSVADNGRGLAPERCQQLRDFLSGQTSTTPGPGLGLVLVREVLSRWDCSLQVESEPGRGSIFTVRLPSERIAQ